MLLAMSQDIRVISSSSPTACTTCARSLAQSPRRRAIARETIDIYAPIAKPPRHAPVALELEICRSHTSTRCATGAGRCDPPPPGQPQGDHREGAGGADRAARQGGLPAEVGGREKSLYGVYRKMREKHLTFEQVYDV